MRRKLNPQHGYLLMLAVGACMTQISGCSSGDGTYVEDGGATSLGGTTNVSGAAQGGRLNAQGGRAQVDAGAGGDVHVDAGAGGEANTNGGRAQGGSLGEAGATQGGTLGSGGSGNAAGGATNGNGGAAIAGAANGGAPAANGGAASANGGTGGASGGTTGAAGAPAKCTFHTETQGTPMGEAGAGGAGPAPTITSQKNGFAGTYLADGKGRALYIYGADAPGDCNNAPITNCFNDCAIAWPIFNGEPRVVGAGVDDAAFGSIVRSDGLTQTTYLGWPLYYYKNDVATGDVKGQAVGKIWQLAQLVLPNIEIMRNGNIRFLGDGEGHALYASSADTVGTAGSPPASACTGSCLDTYPAFAPTYTSPVTYLNAADFSYFARGDGKVQLAYKGAPLYRAVSDTRSGTMNGVATGWALVAP